MEGLSQDHNIITKGNGKRILGKVTDIKYTRMDVCFKESMKMIKYQWELFIFQDGKLGANLIL